MCVPLSNQSCQVKAALINVNSVESFHYPFVVNNIKLVEGLNSIVNKGIRAILNLCIFFYKKISHACKKSTKSIKSIKIIKSTKSTKLKQTTFLLLDVFMHMKMVSFLFLFACMRFVPFVRVKSSCKKKKRGV